MKPMHLLLIGGAALIALAAFVRPAAAAQRRGIPGGGNMPYFPGESPLPPKLNNWSPALYERLGGLFLQNPVMPTEQTRKPDAIDRVPVRDVYAAVMPETAVHWIDSQ